MFPWKPVKCGGGKYYWNYRDKEIHSPGNWIDHLHGCWPLWVVGKKSVIKVIASLRCSEKWQRYYQLSVLKRGSMWWYLTEWGFKGSVWFFRKKKGAINATTQLLRPMVSGTTGEKQTWYPRGLNCSGISQQVQDFT